VPYHHVVFTIPHEINELVITNKDLLYSILFKASAFVERELAALVMPHLYRRYSPQ